jgi:hypothetical protein
MDLYKETGLDQKTVDLDDLTIYNEELLEKTNYELYRHAWKILGEALYYMKYIYPEVDFGEWQTNEIDKNCKEFAKERTKLHNKTEDIRLWLLKFIYKFEDLVENFC